MLNEPILIGVTGNIGSGKSSFCKLLRESGHTVIATDEVAQEQLDDPESLKKISKRWGREVVVKGKPDRKKIAEIVFNSKAELDFLNSVVHPKVLAALQQIAESSPASHLFFEVPLLFEAGMQLCFDYIILIHADRDIRLKRLLKGGKANAADIEARMDTQIDDLEKAPLCNLVINNNGSPRSLKTQFANFISRLDSIKQKNKLPFATL